MFLLDKREMPAKEDGVRLNTLPCYVSFIGFFFRLNDVGFGMFHFFGRSTKSLMDVKLERFLCVLNAP